ncbi:hypothetical protein [Niveibacterium sp. SC-1]|uniref:hypothetical protein n=1 Tax=Niveibacterium sp. SC-1 TaxID=3135646 RepID=UPI00311D4F99
MSIPNRYSRHVEPLLSETTVDQCTAEYCSRLHLAGYWGIGERVLKVLCRDAKAAFSDQDLESVPAQPSLHIFGAGQNIRCVGKTDSAHRARLRGRYLSASNSQFAFAVAYKPVLRDQELDGLPPTVIARTSLARRRGAVDFAQHNTNAMWVSFIPMERATPQMIEQAERLLIGALARRNADAGFLPPINVQHNA